MEVRPQNLTDKLKTSMTFYTQRQKVLAQNIANIDTPGFQARDIPKPDFGKTLARTTTLSMVGTSPMHQGGTLGKGTGGLRTVDDRKTFETTPTKNDVTLEDQMAKISDTGAQYQISSSLLKKYMGLYRSALGNR
jgi:flagellar basal-body rod protein FlgB